MRGQRTVWVGRQQVHAALSMAAPVATRFNPAIRAFYQRLVAADKPKDLALSAAIRMLVVILNAILRTGTSGRSTENPSANSAKVVSGAGTSTVTGRKLHAL